MGHRIFLAGASGAIGQRLIPQLLAAGHKVTGTTRNADKAATLRATVPAAPSIISSWDRASTGTGASAETRLTAP